MNRKDKLIPDGIPKYIRVYSNPHYADQYTVVYTGNFAGRNGRCYVRAMSNKPKHSLGVCMMTDYDFIIDHPAHGHLGKKIGFTNLPKDCQEIVINDYKDFWGV